MKTVTILLLTLVVTPSLLQRPAKAQGLPWQQNQIAAGNANQAQMVGAAQMQSGQLARVMITAYDKDGDESLNAVELQAGLMELLLRMYANFAQTQQVSDQGGQQQALGFQGRRAIPSGPPGRGGRGRGQ